MPIRRTLMIIVSIFCCMPLFAQFGGGPTLSIQVISEKDGSHPAAQTRYAVVVEVPHEWHVNANKPLDEFLIPTAISITSISGISTLGIYYPEAKNLTFSFQKDPLAVYEGKFAIGLILDIAESVKPDKYELAGILRYQACNDKQCALPKNIDIKIPVTVVATDTPLKLQHEDIFKSVNFVDTSIKAKTETKTEKPETKASTPTLQWKELINNFKIASTETGYMKKDAFLAFLNSSQENNAGTTQSKFADMGIAAILFLIIIGGLGLNLTPCVLPLIPINIAIIGAGAKAGSRKRGFALGGVYGLGIALVYGILGLIVVLTTGSFGSINASPLFNLIIAAIFVLLGLAMFDIISIDFTRFQAKIGIRKNESGSFIIAFLMGCIAALLAGACVAPVVIAVVLFSRDLYAQGSYIGLLLPFILGVGMALPWPFAGAGLSFLPKPGKWMMRVKYVFGVFIIVIAAYYAYMSYTLFSDRIVDQSEVASSVQAMDEEGWLSSLSEGLTMARGENKPVIIDFWATWCKSCMTMNKTTLKEPEVKNALDDFIKVKYQAQDPNEPSTKEIMEYFGVVGLPTYVILR